MGDVVDFQQAQAERDINRATDVLVARVARLREFAQGARTLAHVKAGCAGVEEAAVKAAEAAAMIYGPLTSALADYHEGMVTAFEELIRLDIVPAPTVEDVAAMAVQNAMSQGHVEAGRPGDMPLDQRAKVMLYMMQTACAPQNLARAMVWYARNMWGSEADEVLFKAISEHATLAVTLRMHDKWCAVRSDGVAPVVET